MAEYQSNSDKDRKQAQEAAKSRAVVTGKASTKPKTGFSKFRESFIVSSAKEVGEHIIFDTLVPTIQTFIVNIVTDSLAMMFGQQPPRRNGGSTSSPARVSYRSYYEDRGGQQNRPVARVAERFEDILFDERGDAERVLLRMREQIREFDAVSVADMYDFAGAAAPYTNNRYGWTDLHDAYVERTRDNYYVIRLPRTITL